MNIFIFGAVGAVVAIGIGYLVNQLPPLKKSPRKIHWMIIALLAVLGVGSGSLAYGEFKTEAAADPIAAIQAPRGGEKISRILSVDIGVTRQPPDDHSLWLGYQNEAGGPLIVQAQECVVFQKNADCGPLHVGRDENDTSSFKIFLFDADDDATAHLKNIGAKISGGPGANMALDEWPDGTGIISMIRNITLREQ
jgi:hypothetical protein